MTFFVSTSLRQSGQKRCRILSDEAMARAFVWVWSFNIVDLAIPNKNDTVLPVFLDTIGTRILLLPCLNYLFEMTIVNQLWKKIRR